MSDDRKKLIIFLIIIILVLTAALVYLNTDIFKKSEVAQAPISDNVRFHREYIDVEQTNVFKYATVEEIIQIFQDGTGIVFFGFPSCPWCQKYVTVLNEVALERDIEKIYYYNIKEIRDNDTAEYKQLVEILKDYLEVDDKGNKRIYVPDTYFIKKGQIVGHNNDTATLSGIDVNEYFTEEKRKDLKVSLISLTELLYSGVCKDSPNSNGC